MNRTKKNYKLNLLLLVTLIAVTISSLVLDKHNPSFIFGLLLIWPRYIVLIMFITMVNLRLIEPHIYSVFKNVEVTNSYDTEFGNIYDWVACNPLYNRLIWGYSITKFASIDLDALKSSKKGYVLDLGCGSLAFTTHRVTLFL